MTLLDTQDVEAAHELLEDQHDAARNFFLTERQDDGEPNLSNNPRNRAVRQMQRQATGPAATL